LKLHLTTPCCPVDKPSGHQASESGVQLILNDIHAVVMELDESLLDRSTGGALQPLSLLLLCSREQAD
jgi:hypothetical protein